MSPGSAGSGYSRLSDFTISCFRPLPRCPSPRRPFVLRSPPPSRGGRTAARGSPRPRAPSSFAPTDGRRGRPRLPPGTASPSPVSARCCARRARGRGPCGRPRRGGRPLRRGARAPGGSGCSSSARLRPRRRLGRSLPPKPRGRLREAEPALQHGDGRPVGAPVREAPPELGGVILAQQISPLAQKTPIGEAEHCLSNYRGSLQFWGAVHPRNGRQFKVTGGFAFLPYAATLCGTQRMEIRRFKITFRLLPLSDRIVHFHGLSSTWCSVVSPLTESDAFRVSELNSN